MNGKPVLLREARRVLAFDAQAFSEKRLCDGIVLNMGDTCAYSCEYCYVGSMVAKWARPSLVAHNSCNGSQSTYRDVVIRRRDALVLLANQLRGRNGALRYSDIDDSRMVFTSTLVDVGANMDLLRETADACCMILSDTNWEIRLLSKSSLLSRLVKDRLIPQKHWGRLVFGFSTGTQFDSISSVIETGAARVSKRIEALRWLQDQGLRTFGMLCPSLPQEDYSGMSADLCEAIRADRCEHVWAEVINLRGASLTRTVNALRNAGYSDEAERLASVHGPNAQGNWEEYARNTFLAHSRHIPASKLRFLQYVTPESRSWWKEREGLGAILLGKHATLPENSLPAAAQCLGASLNLAGGE